MSLHFNNKKQHLVILAHAGIQAKLIIRKKEILSGKISNQQTSKNKLTVCYLRLDPRVREDDKNTKNINQFFQLRLQ